MRKLYSFILVAMAMMMSLVASAEEAVSINDLRGSYVFRGKATDWQGFGVNPPTIFTLTLSINETDNSVTMTGFIGTVWLYGEADDGSEDVEDAIHGTFNPELQTLTFEDSENYYIMDDAYAWWNYNLCFQISRDETGNIVLDMIPAENGNMCIIQTYDYINGDYVYYNYGYDMGAKMTQITNKATAAIGTIEAGNYEIIYNDADGVTNMIPAVINADEEGNLSLAVNGANLSLVPQTSGRGTNKFTYAYTTSGCWSMDNCYFYGDGENDYDSFCTSNYWGRSEITFYFNGDGTMASDVDIWFGSDTDNGITAYSPILAPEGTFAAGIENVATANTGRQYFDLQGRRIQQPKGLTIVKENGKAHKMLVK